MGKKRFAHYLVVVLVLLCPAFGTSANSTYIVPSASLPAHPRLLLADDSLVILKQKINSNSFLFSIDSLITIESNNFLLLPEIVFDDTDGKLLEQTREAIRRIFYLTYSYRMTSNSGYAKKAKKELMNIVNFAGWNSSQYLHISEMTFACALGYDWLYNFLSEEDKNTLQSFIYNTGLGTLANDKLNFWKRFTNNINQVCSSSLAFGAASIFETYPDASASAINNVIDYIKLPMAVYANNGAFPEGCNYWSYGTTYNILFVNMLNRIWNSTFGLENQTGFLQTGSFIQNMEGPKTAQYELPMVKNCDFDPFTNRTQCFNFSDATRSLTIYPAMFWFAAQNNDQSLIRNEILKIQELIQTGNTDIISSDRFLPMLLIWSANLQFNTAIYPQKRMYVGQGNGACATMRSAWDDDKAIFLGVKGGSPQAGHGHMDMGSFVMDALGVRWAYDFGLQAYYSLEQAGVDLWNMTQSSTRWNVFRYNNASHNTLTINGQKQLVSANIQMEQIVDKPDTMSVTMNLTPAYSNEVASLYRTASLLNSNKVCIRDIVETKDVPDTIRWNMLTSAKPQLVDNHTIYLYQNGKKMEIRLNCQSSITSKIWSTISPNAYDASNKGYLFVGFEIVIPANTRDTLNTILTPTDTAVQYRNQLNESFEFIDEFLWNMNPTTGQQLNFSFINNPLPTELNTSRRVMRIQKTGNETAKNWNNVYSSNFYLPLISKNQFKVSADILFRTADSNPSSTVVGIRLGDNASCEVRKTVNVSDNWQHLTFDFSTISEISNLISLGKDTCFNTISIFPRKDTDQLKTVILYIDNLQILTESIPAGISNVPGNNMNVNFSATPESISLTNPQNTTYTVAVRNLAGVLVKYAVSSDEVLKTNIQDLPPSVYFATYYSDLSKAITYKFIKL